MILKALKYKSSWLGDWSIVSGTTHDEFVQFENINLFVGRNASGKTKFIEAIRWISDLLDPDSKETTSNSYAFDLLFQDEETEIKYNVVSDDHAHIIQENLIINKEVKLNRGKGLLYYEAFGQNLPFQTDDHFLAISRRDNLQQPFFETLQNWGKNLFHYSFGGNMGKGQYKMNDWEDTDKINFKNFSNISVIFKNGKTEFGDKYEKKIIEDMKIIDYHITTISIQPASKYLFLQVQEEDLDIWIYFENMSQGMARAFSLIVQLNYSLMAKIPSCILIDDIGEGLDYDRSKKLIELIIEKAEGSNIQVFMTTNDRFVMNSVPLKYWSVIHREGNKSVFYNYKNSKQTFDDFAFTGLNNFDFFATEFYRQGFEEFIATAQ
jgi:energy-coupling factor transporter ATP-binding protein EcfA2